MTQSSKGGSIASNAVTKLVNVSTYKSMDDQASNIVKGGSIASNAVTKLVNADIYKSMDNQASNIIGGLCMKCTKCGGEMKIISKKGGDIPVGSSLVKNDYVPISGGKKCKNNKKCKKGGTFGESLYELTNNFQNTKPINLVNNESVSQEFQVKSELPIFPSSSKAIASSSQPCSNISQLVKIPNSSSLNSVKPSVPLANVSSSSTAFKASPILPGYDLIQSKSHTFIGGKKCKSKKCKTGGRRIEYEPKTLSQLMSQDSNSDFFLNNKKGGKKTLKGGDIKNVPVALQYNIESSLPVNTYGNSSVTNKTITNNIIANQPVSSLSSIGKSTVYGNPSNDSIKFVYSSTKPIVVTDVTSTTPKPTLPSSSPSLPTCKPAQAGGNKLQKKIKLLLKRAKLIQGKKH